jgi:hypothetical protein
MISDCVAAPLRTEIMAIAGILAALQKMVLELAD